MKSAGKIEENRFQYTIKSTVKAAPFGMLFDVLSNLNFYCGTAKIKRKLVCIACSFNIMIIIWRGEKNRKI